MSRQRKRHLERQPAEEAVRLALTSFVGNAGIVDVQRMSYDWREDDLLVQVQLVQPLTGSTLALFRRELSRLMHENLPPGGSLEEWLLVIQSGGETIERIGPHDKAEEPLPE